MDMNVTEIANFIEKCTGCNACYSVCPNDAIYMKKNDEGFLYPLVDKNKCNGCRDCLDVCQIYNTDLKTHRMNKIFAYQSKDNNSLIRATSGAAFPDIAKWIVSKKGTVFGAAYDDDMNVVHIGVSKDSDLTKFNGSKYVQSNIGNTYEQAQKHLEHGKWVLFSGTPCQIRGLYLFLGKDYDKLLTIDVICYGVPSGMLFKKYIELVESKEKAKIIDFKFRDKRKYGWSHTVVIKFKKKSGEIYEKIYGNEYTNLYYRAWGYDCLRDSCYQCEMVSKDRVSDITIGNFWGIERVSKTFDCKAGVSIVSINNEKKNHIIDILNNSGILEEQGWEMIDKIQHGLRGAKDRPPNRDVVYNELSKGYIGMINNLYPLKLKNKIVNKLPLRVVNFLAHLDGIRQKIINKG